jgi:multiple sugar transport system permease protein
MMTRATRRNLRNGLLFISPWLVGFLVFTVYPMGASLYYSFTDYNVLEPPTWVGFRNYRELFTTDPLFYKAVSNTILFALVSLPLGLVLGLTLALLLNVKVRGMAIYRTLFFLPSIVPDIASALLWAWLLNPQFGLINSFLRLIGVVPPGWLSDPNWSKPALLLIALWSVGGSMIIYLAALQEVPSDLYEAATLDGAGRFAKLRHITLPMISPTIFFNLVLGTIGTLQYFTTAFVLTGGQGTPVDSTLFYNMLLYRNAFTYLKMGYASAMAWLLFIVILILTFLIFRSSRRWVFYMGETR